MFHILLTVALAAVSCAPQEQPEGTPFSEVVVHKKDETGTDYESILSRAEATQKMKTKAEDFRKATSCDSLRNGVYVYSATVTTYGAKPEKLAARLAALGFRDVYLSPGAAAISNASNWLKQFNTACHGYGMGVYAIKLASTDVIGSASTVSSEVNAILSYNGKVSASERFDGISADIEPHTAKSGVTVSGTKYTWNSSTGYGKGGPNDMLLKYTIERLAAAGTTLHSNSLKLNEAYWYNYQKYYDSKELSYGEADQFLEHCDWLVLMSYYSDKVTVWTKSTGVLAAASPKGSVSICLKVKQNSQDSESLQPKGWQYLLETCSYIVKNASAYQSFRGIDQFAYDGLEQMWQWENDKN